MSAPPTRPVSGLGPVVAERVLERPNSKRPIRARLGTPRPSRHGDGEWECPFQILGASDRRIRFGYGVDSLQALLNACLYLRRQLTLAKASWMGMGTTGIPPMIPEVMGPAFTAQLESMVQQEFAKVLSTLKRAHKKGARGDEVLKAELSPAVLRDLRRARKLTCGNA
jgi:hypothetical protein